MFTFEKVKLIHVVKFYYVYLKSEVHQFTVMYLQNWSTRPVLLINSHTKITTNVNFPYCSL